MDLGEEKSVEECLRDIGNEWKRLFEIFELEIHVREKRGWGCNDTDLSMNKSDGRL